MKVNTNDALREAVLFGKRVTGSRAKDLALVDEVASEADILITAKQLAFEALGKDGLDRDMLNKMKIDLYPRKLMGFDSKL